MAKMLKTKIVLCLCSLLLNFQSGDGLGAKIDLTKLVDEFSFESLQELNLKDLFQRALDVDPLEEPNEITDQLVLDKIEELLPDLKNTTAFNHTFPEVESALGFLRGRRMKSFFQRDFIAFQGIPYADQPPRFQMSEVRRENLTDSGEVFDATYFRPKCPQGSMVMSGPAGSEDCLTLNIYAPVSVLDDSVKLPVMVFIHGGAFISGDASLYVPTKLMDKNVVVVVIQYRLGSLGFLAAGIDEAPGNMGLMDQVNALIWVQEYIHQGFGGDPDCVCVFGQSAGSASASWLMFTPLTYTGEQYSLNPLLHRIIAESGSANDIWAVDPKPGESLAIHAEATGCSNFAKRADVIDCMVLLPFEDIVNGFNKVYHDDRASGGLGFLGMSPVIQNGVYFLNVSDGNRVIVEHPLVSATQGRHANVEIMTGSVREEGSMVAGLVWFDFLEPNNLTYDEDFMSAEFLPFAVDAFGITDITGSVANSIRLAFFKYAEMGVWDSMVGGLVDSLGMMFLKTGGWTLCSALSHSEKNPIENIFIYSFEFDSDDSLFDWYFLSTPEIPMEGGITHADDLLYLFYLPSYLNDDEKQLETVRRMTTAWANFAKYGNPTPGLSDFEEEEWVDLMEEWKPFTWNGKEFMLMEDKWHMEVDATLRWTHNSESDSGTTNNKTSNEAEYESSYSSTNHEINVATVSLAVTCSVLMLCIVALAFKAFRS